MSGPFLYDDGPAPLHTGTPRRRQGLLVALLLGTAACAALMVALTLLVKGTGEEQAQEVTGVFLAALAQDDTETAHELLCQAEQARLGPDEVGAAYLGEGGGEVGEVRQDGDARLVTVHWADGSSEFTVIGEDGLRVCGVTPGG
jgi:hypothetical protein